MTPNPESCSMNIVSDPAARRIAAEVLQRIADAEPDAGSLTMFMLQLSGLGVMGVE